MMRNSSLLSESYNWLKAFTGRSKFDVPYLHEGGNLKFGHPEFHFAQNTLKSLQIYLLGSPYCSDFLIRLHSPKI